ncbi:CU044_2847 family protein [Phormidium tenue]|jgi:hypothetical protein|uniref:Trypsin-co-occurring domain-containing protein n=1 Tax=Phormidium tenue FACHB-1050 TaxID=2692857 RepID=A0ABR8C4M8_9CYAN|nr:CU044_2847 family protein [Phormidium tenue]MBD2315261.1 hypothetical protein [Phormidium tenue FACHB-1050]
MGIFQEPRTEVTSIELPNGELINVEVNQTGREDVSFGPKSFSGVTKELENIVKAMLVPLQRVQPDKATIKFGIQLRIDSGRVEAVVTKGINAANFEITMEWNRDRSTEP